MATISPSYTDLIQDSRMSQTANLASSSPCVGICTLDRSSNTCIGCGRLLSEIAAWSRMTVQERSNVCELAAKRLSERRRANK
jgi:predicted Fe-S protein YdhL (DUF1289 family)